MYSVVFFVENLTVLIFNIGNFSIRLIDCKILIKTENSTFFCFQIFALIPDPTDLNLICSLVDTPKQHYQVSVFFKNMSRKKLNLTGRIIFFPCSIIKDIFCTQCLILMYISEYALLQMSRDLVFKHQDC